MSSANDLAETERSSEESRQHIHQILQAASKHDNAALQEYCQLYTFPDCEAVDVLDPDSGRCPLHAAIASCAKEQSNGEFSEALPSEDAEEHGGETVKLLLENGAIWNQLDKNDETPGCVANRLGLEYLYQLMVDAGVRAEVLLNRLEGYEQLDDEMTEGDEATEGDPNQENVVTVESDDDEVPELIVADVKNGDYLSSTLSFMKDKLLDDQSNGVMMEWERKIMQESAEALVDKAGMKVINIGAGMLIFDSIVQGLENKPVSHHIVEAHPDVLADMRAKGWHEKAGVVIHTGKWQEVLPDLVAEGETFDAIYFDTFAESYSQFRDFFQEQVIGLLNPQGKWSFFNGMGADRQISYDVYQKVVELDLFESGFDVEWQSMQVPVLDEQWEGVKRKYWNIDTYRLPVCRFMD